MKVRCPDCSEQIEVPAGTKSGDLLECPNCAGHALRVREEDTQWVATLAYRVSCPECEQPVTLPDDAKAGDAIECCGRRYRLTFEYGAFAAEWEDTMWRDRWLILGVIGAAVTCLACLTPALVLVLGAMGLGTVTGRLDLVMIPLLMGFGGLAVYRYRRPWRRTR